jgi:hypothetical protein
MEESEYKSTYDEITRIACVFEKALTNNQCRCSYSQHFWLADREGYSCKSASASTQCARLLEKLRETSRFSLKLATVGNQLPHNMDIRVQAGGLSGMQKLYGDKAVSKVSDVRQLVEVAMTREGTLDDLPYSEIIKSIAEYKTRSRSKKLK